MEEAITDPQVKHRGTFHRYEDGSPQVEGVYTVPVAAFKYKSDGPKIESPPPTLGQHNEEVLKELGYQEEEITHLRNTKVIG